MDPVARIETLLMYQLAVFGLWEVVKILAGPRISGQADQNAKFTEHSALCNACHEKINEIEKGIRKIVLLATIINERRKKNG